MELCTQIFEHFQLTSRGIESKERSDIEAKRRDDVIKLDTLRSICLVSKSFHWIASPILYRVFPFTSDSLGCGTHATNNDESRDELYLQTLHQNPAYADALRFINMDVSRPDDENCVDCLPDQAARACIPTLIDLAMCCSPDRASIDFSAQRRSKGNTSTS